MADVAIVNDTIDELRKLGLSSFTFCGDRGFYSAGNLQNLSDKGIGFLIPVPSSIGWSRKMIAQHRDSIISPMNVIYDGDGISVYGKTVYKTTPEFGRSSVRSLTSSASSMSIRAKNRTANRRPHKTSDKRTSTQKSRP